MQARRRLLLPSAGWECPVGSQTLKELLVEQLTRQATIQELGKSLCPCIVCWTSCSRPPSSASHLLLSSAGRTTVTAYPQSAFLSQDVAAAQAGWSCPECCMDHTEKLRQAVAAGRGFRCFLTHLASACLLMPERLEELKDFAQPSSAAQAKFNRSRSWKAAAALTGQTCSAKIRKHQRP